MHPTTLLARLLPAVALVLGACGTGSNDEPLAGSTAASPVQQADGTRWVAAGADMRLDASTDIGESSSGGTDAPSTVTTTSRLQWGGWVPSITPQGLGRSGCAVRWSREFADADTYLAASRTARSDYWGLSETWETLPAVAAVGAVRPAGGHVELDDARRMLTMVVPVDATAACPQGEFDAPAVADASTDPRVAALAASAGNAPSAAVTAARKRWVQAFVAAVLPELRREEPSPGVVWLDRLARFGPAPDWIETSDERQRLAACLAPALEHALANPAGADRQTTARNFDTCIGKYLCQPGSVCKPVVPGAFFDAESTQLLRAWIGRQIGWLLQQGWQRHAPQLNRNSTIGVAVSWVELDDLGPYLAQANPAQRTIARTRWIDAFVDELLPDTDRVQPLPARPVWLDRDAGTTTLGRHLRTVERQRLAFCLGHALKRTLDATDYAAHVAVANTFDRCIGTVVGPRCLNADCSRTAPSGLPTIPSDALRVWIRAHGNWMLQQGWSRYALKVNRGQDQRVRVWIVWGDIDGLGVHLTRLRPKG